MKVVEWVVDKIRTRQREKAWDEAVLEDENNPFKLREKSVKELYDWINGFSAGAAERLFGESEIRRRDSAETRRVARIAIYLSVAAFLMSVIVHFKK